ncbi:ShlB/FhaC/HecB family hemolysin secretion/activation protein [Pseudomonas putida]|uniref:Haemolysin activator HlyB C-terminal domain-containing protein n=1 Tax=Pseudomonas putida TaxID=303 RepID=A0A1Q9QZ28_PSEPU|nr:ShlB/FhaC/HecB family hemolysin secretion/activation protein [Pseudomonas putida]OLS60419.1 hypothetical protein PSEMO_48300 [Pseudomonas putida]
MRTLLSTACLLPLSCLAQVLPFQELPDLPTRSSLSLADTHYHLPEAITAMPFLSGTVALDNFGGHDDQGRLASGLNLHGLLATDDLLSLRSMGSAEAGHYHWAAYSLAVSPWSSRVGFILSDLAYKLGDELQALDAKGKARTASAFILQPLLQTAGFDLKARLQYDDKHLHDESGLLAFDSDKHSRVFDYGLLATAGRSVLELNWRQGRLEIEGSPWSLVGKADTGRFSVLRASLARLQPLGDRLALYVGVRGQWSNDNLDDSEKLYLGGVFGARYEPQTAAFGDQGWQASAELRYALTQHWQLVAFADHGEARLNTPSWTVDTAPRRLSAAGFGGGWSNGGWNISALAGWPLGERESEERQPRIWGQLAYSF